MKKIAIAIFLFLILIQQLYSYTAELFFCIEDNHSGNYKVIARRINLNEPLFGPNFMAVDTDQYNFVVCDSVGYESKHTPFVHLLAFDFLRDNNSPWPAVGEGKLEFTIFKADEVPVFRFSIDLAHYLSGTRDIYFYYSSTTNTLFAKANDIQTPINNNSFVNCWELRGEERDISSYVNDVELTNFVATGPEPSIKSTITSGHL